MAADSAKLGTSKSQSGLCAERDEQLKQVMPERDRRRLAEHVETYGHPRRSSRLQKKLDNKEAECSSRPVRLSHETVSRRQDRKQEQPGPRGKNLQARKDHKRHHNSKGEGRLQTQPISTRAKARKNPKRCRSRGNRDALICNTKCPQSSDADDLIPRIQHRKSRFIESWLRATSWSRRAWEKTEDQHATPSEDMVQNFGGSGRSLDDIRGWTRLADSSRLVANVRDATFRDSLEYRNVYINSEAPPVRLMRRAEEIIRRPRMSPEMDDAFALAVKDTAHCMETMEEERLVDNLVPMMIPRMRDLPSKKLATAGNTMWRNATPIPLDPSVRHNPLPLSSPKPDRIFGYSKTAFNKDRIRTIDLLIDKSGRSYAIPDNEIRLPFFEVECKSQAKSGTHFIAMNQAANTGSVALHGYLELLRCSFGVEAIDYSEPQFFSLTIDQVYVQINVHWVSAGADNAQFSFHVGMLERYFLNRLDDIKAVRQAVKNILDYAVTDRLPRLCEALDAYREKFDAKADRVIPKGNRPAEEQMERVEHVEHMEHVEQEEEQSHVPL